MKIVCLGLRTVDIVCSASGTLLWLDGPRGVFNLRMSCALIKQLDGAKMEITPPPPHPLGFLADR